MKNLLPLLLLAAPAGAQAIRAIPSEAALSGVRAASISAVPALMPGGFSGVSAVPVLSAAAAPSAGASAAPAAAPAAASAASADPQEVLVNKIGARLCGSTCVERRKNAEWIGEVAAANPREPVQAAAVRVLADDAMRGNDLNYFETAVSAIESFAGSTEHDAVYEDAVRRLVAAARNSGGRQGRTALGAIMRISRTPERRAYAASQVAALRGDPSVRWDPDAVDSAVRALSTPAPR